MEFSSQSIFFMVPITTKFYRLVWTLYVNIALGWYGNVSQKSLFDVQANRCIRYTTQKLAQYDVFLQRRKITTIIIIPYDTEYYVKPSSTPVLHVCDGAIIDPNAWPAYYRYQYYYKIIYCSGNRTLLKYVPNTRSKHYTLRKKFNGGWRTLGILPRTVYHP